jgi:hypothetical protein
VVRGVLVFDPATGEIDGVAPFFSDDMFFIVGTRG